MLTKSLYATIPEQFNVAQHLIQKNLESGQADKIAFQSQSISISYKQLHDRVKKFSEYLDRYAVRAEERIAILLPDTLEFVVAFLGTIWKGSVAVLINEAATPNDIIYIINDCRARIVVTTEEWKEKLDAHNNISNIAYWICIDNQPTLWEQLNRLEGAGNAYPTSRDEPAFMAYTSGSTGKPKGVVHAHYSPIIAAEYYAKQTLNLTADDLIYSAPPLSFSYGLGASLYMPLYVGASAIIADVANPFGYIDVINKYKPTVFFGIPNNYANILALDSIAPLERARMRLCVCAGEQLPVSLWERWHKKYNLAICEGVGTTESMHIFISNRPDQCVAGKIGKAVNGYEINIVDEHGNTVPTGVVGLLEVKGDGLMLSYWNRLSETQKSLNGKVLRTGDYCSVDSNGYYSLLGRKDGFFKINGMWILPHEIEDELIKNPYVDEAAIIIKNNSYVEDIPEIVAFVSLNNLRPSESDISIVLKNFLKNRISKYKVPKNIYFIDALPRTITGKIDRRKLQESVQ